MAQSKYTRLAVADELLSLEREEDAQLLSFPDRTSTDPAAGAPAAAASADASGFGGAGVADHREQRQHPHQPEHERQQQQQQQQQQQTAAEQQFYTSDTLPADFLCLTEPIPTVAPRRVGQAVGPQGYGAPPGILTIELLQARLAKNYGLMRMDPYCRFSIGRDQVDSALCSNGGKEPRWNERLQIVVPPGYNTMTVEIFDHGALSDKLIATGVVKLDALLAGGPPHEDWFALSGQQGQDKEGQLNMHLTFTPPPPTLAYYGPPLVPAMPMFGYPMPMPMPMSMPAPAPTAAPPPGPPPVSAVEVGQLCEMFPGLGRDVVETVLVANGGNRDATLTALLSLTDT